MHRLIRVLFAALCALALTSGIAAGATAQPLRTYETSVRGLPAANGNPGDDVIDHLDVEIQLNSSGDANIRETYRWDFGQRRGLGFYRTLVTKMGYSPDPDKIRVYEVSGEHVSSASGAPAGVWRESESRGLLKLSIGAPDGSDDRVTGIQTYTLTYQVKGAINAIKEGDNAGLEEFYWNIFDNLDVPARSIDVTVSGPAEVKDISCFVGPSGSDTPCNSYNSSLNRSTYSFSDVQKRDAVTIMAAFPSGTFASTAPILVDAPPDRSRQFTSMLSMIAGVLAAVVGVVVAGSFGLRRIHRRRERDEAWMGVTPGVISPGAPVGPAEETPIAVRFTPPENLTPAETVVLMNKARTDKSLGVMLVDLAIKGYLWVSEVSWTTLSGKKPNDWALTLTDQVPEGLASYENRTLSALRVFANPSEHGPQVYISRLKRKFHTSAAMIDHDLMREVERKQLFKSQPKKRSKSSAGMIFFLIVLGFFMLNMLGTGVSITAATQRFSVMSWLPFAVVLVIFCSIMISAFGSGKKTARTAYGHALFKQAEGFKEYLETAEADQIIHESKQAEFSRWLPWAMAFGIEDRWGVVMDQIVQRSGNTGYSSWYQGRNITSYTDFSSSVSQFGSSSSTSMVSQPSSSGSSGGSGGFSGGGSSGGGGGGGSAGGR
ncbi:Predicted membrane protein [Bowdeniella nasicola]|uniref:Predicted membrane protein n=1 Tax=Bowdeniella nasicola TaxID=208480 RepID=A0A1H3WA09_9ACTO|nr:Predicted membrane protein [Bowdeniella nasicola]